MPSTRRAAPRRLIRPATVIGGLLLLLVVLVLLAIPFLSAPGHAEDARAELTATKDALDAGDTDAAVAAVERARSETDDLQGSVQGIGGALVLAAIFANALVARGAPPAPAAERRSP